MPKDICIFLQGLDADECQTDEIENRWTFSFPIDYKFLDIQSPHEVFPLWKEKCQKLFGATDSYLLRQINLQAAYSNKIAKEYSVPLLLTAKKDCNIRAFFMHFDAKDISSNCNCEWTHPRYIFPLPKVIEVKEQEHIRGTFKLSLVEKDDVPMEWDVSIVIKYPIQDTFKYRFQVSMI